MAKAAGADKSVKNVDHFPGTQQPVESGWDPMRDPEGSGRLAGDVETS